MQPLAFKTSLAGAHREILTRLRGVTPEPDEARAIARILLEEVTQTRHAHLLFPERLLSESEMQRLEVARQRLATGEPLPYVLGRAWFRGLKLRCDARALIPRPETEVLVDVVLRRLQQISSPRIADLGTGTGAIALSLALERPDAEVWATDVSPAARELTIENATLLELSQRLHIVAGHENDWAATLPRAFFHAIVSNPPYLASNEIAQLQLQLQHEPRLALDGGADGLDAYRQLASQIGALLEKDGFFACELGADQFSAVRDIFTARGWHVEAPIRDLAGIERVLCATPGATLISNA